MAIEYLKRVGKTAASGEDDMREIVAAAVQVSPVALSACFVKGVLPEWDLKDIYWHDPVYGYSVDRFDSDHNPPVDCTVVTVGEVQSVVKQSLFSLV